jgi:tRNA-2-methylthio-N6-dimethylallyladenosine synthase
VFGPQTLHRLPELLANQMKSKKSQVDISFPEIEKFDHLPPARREGVSAFVSIMEGCSKYCSYCVVPYTRGEEINRPLDDVLLEVAQLAGLGVREINLLGQNVNAYRGVMGNTAEICDFATLLDYVSDIPGIERIRYTTSHPNEFTPALIEAYAKLPKLVSHLHLPAQHGSDVILAAMKRGYTSLQYKSIIRKLRVIRPELRLSTDLIIGFPGESDADHAKTMKLIEDMQFDNSFSFIFSPRPGTPAASLADDTPHDVKHARLLEVQKAINDNTHALSDAFVGKSTRILVEGPSRQSKPDALELMGRTECNRVINFVTSAQGMQRLPGQILDIAVTQRLGFSLRGELALQIKAIMK